MYEFIIFQRNQKHQMDFSGTLCKTGRAVGKPSGRYQRIHPYRTQWPFWTDLLAGRLIEEADALGTLVEYTYDYANRQKNIWTGEALRAKHQTESLESDQRSASAGKPSQTYIYDARGNITAATDGNGNTIQYHFNSMNKLEEIVDQNGEKETFTYDNR